MRLKRIRETIPIALAELHEAGHDEVDTGDLCRQIGTHDPKYIKRRSTLKKVFEKFGIKTKPPAPPYRARIQIPLTELERQGVIEGNFEKRDDGRLPRRLYRLVDTEQATRVDELVRGFREEAGEVDPGAREKVRQRLIDQMESGSSAND